MFRLRVDLLEADTNVERLDRHARALREDLMALDVESVDLSAVISPAGAKSGAATTVGALVVALAGSSVLTQVVETVGNWIPRGERRRVTFTVGDVSLELSSATLDQQARVIDALLAHVEAGQRDDHSA